MHNRGSQILCTPMVKNMFEKFDDITEVYIRLASLNRMVISFDPKLENEAAAWIILQWNM